MSMEKEHLELCVRLLEMAIEDTLPEALARTQIKKLERRIEQLGSPDAALFAQLEAYRRMHKSWNDIALILNKGEDTRFRARRATEWTPANIRMWHRRYTAAEAKANA